MQPAAIRPIAMILLTATTALLLLAVFSNAWVVTSTRAQVVSDLAQLPEHRVGLLLGTSPYTRGGESNAHFHGRIDAAAKLLAAGKIRHILISGSNPDNRYNEPREMYRALVARGVPADRLTFDFAGFRTLDSVVRAKRVFQLDDLTIISQRYHDYRALFIANHEGLDAVAWAAGGGDFTQSPRTHTREMVARIKAVLDLYVLGTAPRHLGDPEIIPVNEDEQA